MTDARFPERWLNDRRVLRLSDAGFRLYVVALAWSAANRTDGVIWDDDLALMTAVDTAGAEELAKAALWEREADRWIIADYADTQSSRDELVALDNARRSARERKARYRAKKRGRNVDSHVDKSRDYTGQDRQGQDRPGALDGSHNEVEWPTPPPLA